MATSEGSSTSQHVSPTVVLPFIVFRYFPFTFLSQTRERYPIMFTIEVLAQKLAPHASFLGGLVVAAILGLFIFFQGQFSPTSRV